MNKYIFLTIVVFLFACSNKNEEEKIINEKTSKEITLTDEQIKLAQIETGKIKQKEISTKISCKGQIIATPQNRAKVSVPAAGYVNRVFVQNGQLIQKGSPIISLEHPSYIELQKNYLQAQSKFEYIEKEYERQKILYEQNANTAKVFEKTKSEYKELKSELQAGKLQLELINIDAEKLTSENIQKNIIIYAPISGSINKINISIGQFIKSGDMILEIIGNNEFLLELQVFEKNIQNILVGQKVVFTCSNPKSTIIEHTAEIKYIGNLADENSKTFMVQAKPENCTKEMRHGLYVNAEIIQENKMAYVLPETAIIQEGEEFFVFVENNNNFIKTNIEVGQKDGDFVEIIDAKKIKTSTIVKKGANYIKAEMNK